MQPTKPTTVTVSSPNFPLKTGEVLRIKNSNGRGLWREYHVGPASSHNQRTGPQSFNAGYLEASQLGFRLPNPSNVPHEEPR
jgi:hypothetical protein